MAMVDAGWHYDMRTHGFTGPVGDGKEGWVSWQQAADMLAAAERGHEVEALEVQPISRSLAEHLNGTANDG